MAIRMMLAAIACFAFCATSGCKAYAQDDNTFTVTFGTSLSFASIGPKDTDRRGEFGIDFQDWMKVPLVNWIIDNEQSPGDGVIAELNQ